MRKCSIIVCTHNSSHDAVDCLEVLRTQIDEYAEIIVVDSASHEEHATRIREFAASRPDLQFLRLDKPGVSRARNAGIAVASGDWFAFVDDDAVPFDDWYEKMVAAIDSAPAERAGIGGAVRPRWPSQFDGTRIPSLWRKYLSIVDAPIAGSARIGFSVVAANYVLRRSAMHKIGNFNEQIGRMGGSLLSAGDSHITTNLLDAGYDVWFDPSFAVYHKIPSKRLQLKWIVRRVFMEGVSNVRMRTSEGKPMPASLRSYKLALSIPALAFLSAIKPRRHEPKLRLAMACGSLWEHLRKEPARRA